MKLPEAEWQTRRELPRLLDVLGAGEGDTRYVGGCVRDTLLGLAVNDVDLATRLAPEEVLKRLEAAKIKAVPTGLAHGTVTAVLHGWPVEVTTLRRDVATDGRRATIAYTSDWSEDAARRDFTMNALTADPNDGEIFDYFEGLLDLEKRHVRFIGDPLTRIAEDHLRILRFFRFHARFGGGEPDAAGLEACTARANDLMALSRERIADELLKILALADPTPTVTLMVERNILKPVLPEITSGSMSLLEELVRREEAASLPPDPLRRLSALLPADPDIAASVAARLRLSKKAVKRLTSAAVRSGTGGDKPEMLAYRIGPEEAVDRLLLSPDVPVENVEGLIHWEKPRLRLGGGDLIAMGLTPGPLVAKALQAVERKWGELGFPDAEPVQREIAWETVDQLLRDSQ